MASLVKQYLGCFLICIVERQLVAWRFRYFALILCRARVFWLSLRGGGHKKTESKDSVFFYNLHQDNLVVDGVFHHLFFLVKVFVLAGFRQYQIQNNGHDTAQSDAL